jgi:hypothetical protein
LVFNEIYFCHVVKKMMKWMKKFRTHCFLQKTFILVQLKQYGSQSV